MQPTQIYETVIFDRDSGAGLGFLTIPLNALPPDDRTPLQAVAEVFGFEPPVGAGGPDLPEAIDAMLAHPTEVRGRVPSSEFAEYLARDAHIPVEESPVEGRTLTEVLAGGGLTYGIAHGRPVVVALGLATIILIGPVDAIGEWSTTKMRELLGLPPRY